MKVARIVGWAAIAATALATAFTIYMNARSATVVGAMNAWGAGETTADVIIHVVCFMFDFGLPA